MGFPEHTHKLFLRLLRRLSYLDIWIQLCEADSLANDCHKDMRKITFRQSTRVLPRLINIKIMPIQSNTDVSRANVCLIYAFLTMMKFDLGKIILEHVARVRPFGAATYITQV